MKVNNKKMVKFSWWFILYTIKYEDPSSRNTLSIGVLGVFVDCAINSYQPTTSIQILAFGAQTWIFTKQID